MQEQVYRCPCIPTFGRRARVNARSATWICCQREPRFMMLRHMISNPLHLVFMLAIMAAVMAAAMMMMR